MSNCYSVLMSVYQKDDPRYFKAAVESILQQSLKAQEIILVCDGPLTDELNQVIEGYGKSLVVVRLPENRGLGAALSEGIRYCKCEWIARMDSDDIAKKERCERQLNFLSQYPDVDVVSGTIAEFSGTSLSEEEAKKQVAAYKNLPLTHDEIETYIKYRNPINHPCVMFRRSRAEEAGGYRSCMLFEDYDLWIRMYLNGCKFANLEETILYMRVNGMYQRRGGFSYAKAIASFRVQMYRYHVISFGEFCWTTAVRIIISLLPNRIREIVYDRKLRKH